MLPLFIYGCMKNICLLLLFCFCSCSSDIENNSFLKLSSEILEFPSDGGERIVTIDSNVEWQLSSSLADWLSINKKSGEEIVFYAQENNTEEERKCYVVFEYEEKQTSLLIEQLPKSVLYFDGEDSYSFTFRKDTLKLKLKANVDYQFIYLDDGDNWISQLKKSNFGSIKNRSEDVEFQIEENSLSEKRKARIVVCDETCLYTDTINIYQEGAKQDIGNDGSYIAICKSLKGSANLVVMGDGFVHNDLGKGGYYEECMNKAVEYFFSIEPYRSYQEYFNVYMVMAESEEGGVGDDNFFGGSSAKSKFGTTYGDGTEIKCDDEMVFEYARKVKEIPENVPITVLIVLNSNKYAGTAYLYSDGNSIALCPMSTEEPPNDFEGIVHHEAGGHAFGFLCDEYVYKNKEIPDDYKKDILEWQEKGFQMNLDFTDDLNKILWKDFIGIDKYAPVGAYEGGYEYQYGIWRSEENSCMNNNIPYYNVQSRWCIVNRIMKLSGIDFTIQDFIANDNPVYPTEGRSVQPTDDFIPLGSPKWMSNK